MNAWACSGSGTKRCGGPDFPEDDLAGTRAMSPKSECGHIAQRYGVGERWAALTVVVRECLERGWDVV